ncbi:LLM class flavin-dependent oxidoreductase [Cellvibrio japonicus]|uniref:Alkanesulfonate monooxygenase n=1 Tax=Cellvibrio japonicus (strain Ueda107) TaxID=498211 RepID=B3PJV9_CELJU|nr:LLM class flavin-dependent oxidoreductase [Cellvibrio japonicus]ACE84093.1 alkanesulfonate monooxygenase [Cellvibrio japonicus Ueda107]QEI12739.1 LLM class flavin-dependent oxidoreductase [Cellvibrio japonicus]QEI16313.1 LLM class flavin-dependent oxidoreductase [Cellvibrio japonicus]QEI19891.1 LLM class flavin-dependent oxidoreductase [Cellvibrio japonicus]
MSMRLFWRYGDDNRHPPQMLARALDHLGYTGYLLAIGAGGADMWTTAAALAQHTERVKFLVAAYAGVTSPLQLASQAATLDKLSKGRLVINAILGETRIALAHGLFLEHDERYAMAEEYWSLFRQLFSGEQTTFEGKYIRARGAQLQVESVQQPHPELFFAGSSDPAIQLAARQMQTYLTWGEPVEMAAEKIQRVKEEAGKLGRTLKYGMRLHLIVRDTDELAWAETQRIYDGFDKEKIEVALKVRATSDSVGVQRTTELVKNKSLSKDAREFEVAPNLWAGYTLTGKGPGTALVGSPQTVADRLLEYYNAGIDTFILSGSPRLEEAYRVAEQVFPLLPFEVDKPVSMRRTERSLRAILDTKDLVSAG